jgi:hypothetical protein
MPSGDIRLSGMTLGGVNAAPTSYDLVWVVLEFLNYAAQQRQFHDHEGLTVRADRKPFGIMAGSRGVPGRWW